MRGQPDFYNNKTFPSNPESVLIVNETISVGLLGHNFIDILGIGEVTDLDIYIKSSSADFSICTMQLIIDENSLPMESIGALSQMFKDKSDEKRLYLSRHTFGKDEYYFSISTKISFNSRILLLVGGTVTNPTITMVGKMWYTLLS